MARLKQSDFVVGRGGEREERGIAEAVEGDGAVDVREKIHRDAGADAFFVAHEEDLFELGEALAADGEDDFVDHVLRAGWRQVVDGEHLIGDAQMDLGGSVGGLAEEAAQADAVLGGLLQAAGHADGALAGAHHHDVVRRGEFAADDADHAAGGEAEEEKQTQA